MNDNSEDRITETVLKSFENTPNPRLRTLDDQPGHASARLHPRGRADRGRMVRGDQLPDPHRQDVRRQAPGVHSALRYAGREHAGGCDQPSPGAGATESTIFGPFYRSGAEELPYGASINKDGGGEPAVVSGRVLATDGTPIAVRTLDVWETNENGMYDQQDPAQSGDEPARQVPHR